MFKATRIIQQYAIQFVTVNLYKSNLNYLHKIMFIISKNNEIHNNDYCLQLIST